MNETQINSAARFLIERRHSDKRTCLPMELVPKTCIDALSIQQATSLIISDDIGGWKAGLPVGEKLIVAPIFSNMIHRAPTCTARPEVGLCRIEPEIAFVIGESLPPKKERYEDEEILQSISNAFLAIELIENRYQGTETISHNEHLADCLFNQGICLGPEISVDTAIQACELELILNQGEDVYVNGVHPTQSTIKPLYWLANFLSEQGIGLNAGDIVITGSFAGVIEVLPDQELTIEYSGLGKISLTIFS